MNQKKEEIIIQQFIILGLMLLTVLLLGCIKIYKEGAFVEPTCPARVDCQVTGLSYYPYEPDRHTGARLTYIMYDCGDGVEQRRSI